MRWVKTLFWMVVFIVAVLFSIQNRDEVALRFGPYPLQDSVWLELSQVPIFLVILCSVLLGVLIGGMGDMYRRFQVNKTLRQNRKKIESLEKEVQTLRYPGRGDAAFLTKED